jgi:hypothetical protein
MEFESGGVMPAEMREVNATELGRIVQRRTTPNTAMTITAFWG